MRLPVHFIHPLWLCTMTLILFVKDMNVFFICLPFYHSAFFKTVVLKHVCSLNGVDLYHFKLNAHFFVHLLS